MSNREESPISHDNHGFEPVETKKRDLPKEASVGLAEDGVAPAAFNGLTGIGDLPAQLAVLASFLGTARAVDITVLIAVEGGIGKDIEVCVVCFDGIEHFSPLFVFEYLFVVSTSLTLTIIRNNVSYVNRFSGQFRKFVEIGSAELEEQMEKLPAPLRRVMAQFRARMRF